MTEYATPAAALASNPLPNASGHSSKARLLVRTTSMRLWLAMTLRVSPSMMSSRRDWAPPGGWVAHCAATR